MNRRNFFKLIPLLACLPVVGKVFEKKKDKTLVDVNDIKVGDIFDFPKEARYNGGGVDAILITHAKDMICDEPAIYRENGTVEHGYRWIVHEYSVYEHLAWCPGRSLSPWGLHREFLPEEMLGLKRIGTILDSLKNYTRPNS